MRSSLGLCLLFLGTGCVESTLSEARFDVTERFHDAAEAYVVAGRTFTALADEMAAKKHTLQADVTNEKWNSWLARHTDANGGLVSRDAAGNIVPMPVEQLQASLAVREEHLARMEKSRGLWSRASADWTAALDAFGIANVETLTTQKEIRAAEKSADELARRALTIVGSIAAGAAAAGL